MFLRLMFLEAEVFKCKQWWYKWVRRNCRLKTGCVTPTTDDTSLIIWFCIALVRLLTRSQESADFTNSKWHWFKKQSWFGQKGQECDESSKGALYCVWISILIFKRKNCHFICRSNRSVAVGTQSIRTCSNRPLGVIWKDVFVSR